MEEVKKLQASQIEEKSDFWHVRHRAEMYMDSIRPVISEMKIYDNEHNKIISKEIQYVPGLNKVISEILDNSTDAAVRGNYQVGNKIKVNITDDTVTISDNGTGIDVPSLGYIKAYTTLKSGSNFSDDDRKTTGLNGVGAGITLYTSTYMKVSSVDMEGNRGIFEYINESGKNAREEALEEIKHVEDIAPKSVSHGVTVTFKPDLTFFNSEKITEEHKNLVYTRLINLAFTHPKIEFYFNGTLIKSRDFQSFLKFYNENAIKVLELDKLNIAVFPSDTGYQSIHYANGLNLIDGGTINDYIVNNIVNKFAERLQKGYSKINNAIVKPKLGFVIILKEMVNLRFTSQSKTKLSNTYTELGLPTLNYTEISEKLFKSSAIKDPIIELYKIQQELENKKAQKDLKADKKEIFNPKHLKATKNSEFLMIAEGDSALSSLPSVFGRENIGYIPLTGKLVNSLKSKPAQIKSNPRVSDIIEAYGIGLEESRYQKLIIATDADLDGSHITALIISLFYVLQPQDLYDGKLYKLNTPVMAITDNNDKLIKWYYSLNEYNKDKQNIKSTYNCIHKKGLGSWTSDDLEVIIQKDKLENMIEQIVVTPEDNQTIENWMKDEGVQFRQDTLRNKAFSIENI